jgi:hypothetical protein
MRVLHDIVIQKQPIILIVYHSVETATSKGKSYTGVYIERTEHVYTVYFLNSKLTFVVRVWFVCPKDMCPDDKCKSF